MVEAIRRNFPQCEIADAAFTYQREVDERKRIVVGVNDFAQEGEEQPRSSDGCWSESRRGYGLCGESGIGRSISSARRP
jgi:methylmalonyl-CoA mutase N-terminal domain/subunit